MKLSILVAVYNEKDTIATIIEHIQSIPLEKQIILVDDCSTDGTKELLKEKFDDGKYDVKVLYHETNQGKGASIRTALDHANGDYVIIQDADLEYNPEDMIKLMKYAEGNNADIVYGSRFYDTWRTTSLFHFFVNKFLTVLTNLLYGSNLTDMETCYKLVKTDIMKSLGLVSSRFELEPEITAKLIKKGHSIPEIPISYRGRTYREGKKIGWQDGLIAIGVLIKIRCT